MVIAAMMVAFLVWLVVMPWFIMGSRLVSRQLVGDDRCLDGCVFCFFVFCVVVHVDHSATTSIVAIAFG
jgi:hypothetical protein